MIKWLRKKLGVDFLQSKLDSLYKSFDTDDVALLRYLLGSINLEDVRKKESEMAPDDRKAYVTRLASNWDLIEKIIKKLLVAQEEYMSRGGEAYNGDEVKQIVFGRGTINGLFLVHEILKEAFDEFIGTIKPPEPYDKSKLFPDVNQE